MINFLKKHLPPSDLSLLGWGSLGGIRSILRPWLVNDQPCLEPLSSVQPSCPLVKSVMTSVHFLAASTKMVCRRIENTRMTEWYWKCIGTDDNEEKGKKKKNFVSLYRFSSISVSLSLSFVLTPPSFSTWGRLPRMSWCQYKGERV